MAWIPALPSPSKKAMAWFVPAKKNLQISSAIWPWLSVCLSWPTNFMSTKKQSTAPTSGTLAKGAASSQAARAQVQDAPPPFSVAKDKEALTEVWRKHLLLWSLPLHSVNPCTWALIEIILFHGCRFWRREFFLAQFDVGHHDHVCYNVYTRSHHMIRFVPSQLQAAEAIESLLECYEGILAHAKSFHSAADSVGEVCLLLLDLRIMQTTVSACRTTNMQGAEAKYLRFICMVFGIHVHVNSQRHGSIRLCIHHHSSITASQWSTSMAIYLLVCIHSYKKNWYRWAWTGTRAN